MSRKRRATTRKPHPFAQFQFPADSCTLVAMTSVAYYRKEAERARTAAADSKNPETVLRWLRIAKDYKALADAMEADEAKLSPAMRLPTQQQAQPVQQPQSKLEEC